MAGWKNSCLWVKNQRGNQKKITFISFLLFIRCISDLSADNKTSVTFDKLYKNPNRHYLKVVPWAGGLYIIPRRSGKLGFGCLLILLILEICDNAKIPPLDIFDCEFIRSTTFHNSWYEFWLKNQLKSSTGMNAKMNL